MFIKILKFFKSHNFFVFELFVLIVATGFSTSGISINLLIQDKICLNRYNQSVATCQGLHKPTNSTAQQVIKDLILADSTYFMNYINLVRCIPMFVWSLFVGSFLDKYPGGTKILLGVCLIGDLISVGVNLGSVFYFKSDIHYLLLASCTYFFTGGTTTFLTTTYRYIVVTNEETKRPLKFMIFQFVYFMAFSVGAFLGGQLLKPISHAHHHEPIRTYNLGLMANLAMDVLALVLVFTLKNANSNNQNLNESPINDGEVEVEHLLDNQAKIQNNNYQTISNDPNNNQLPSVSLHQNNRSFIRVLFDLDNVYQTLNSFIRKRENHGRLQIYLLSVIIFGQLLIAYGLSGMLLPFAERVYFWDARLYSTVTAISSVVSAGFMSLGSIGLMKLSDGAETIIAILSDFAAELTIGIFLSPLAYFVSVPIGSLAGFAPISVRNQMSKIISEDEVGKLFSLLSSIESVMPFLGSLIYSKLFAVSISLYPGAIYLFSALIDAFSLGFSVFEQIYCNR